MSWQNPEILRPKRFSDPLINRDAEKSLVRGPVQLSWNGKSLPAAAMRISMAGCVAVGSSCVRTPKEGGNPHQALVNSMNVALKQAQVDVDQIGHINAHGCGSEQMDAAEAAAIHEVFGSLGNQVPVTAMKPYFGNCGAGTGTMELAASLLAMKEGLIPHTLNYSTPDPECDLNIVSREPQKTDQKYFMKLSVSRTGRASAIVVESV